MAGNKFDSPLFTEGSLLFDVSFVYECHDFSWLNYDCKSINRSRRKPFWFGLQLAASNLLPHLRLSLMCCTWQDVQLGWESAIKTLLVPASTNPL